MYTRAVLSLCVAILYCCVLGAPAAARRKVTAKRKQLHRAMIALGVPKRIAWAYRTGGKLPKPICDKLVYKRYDTYYVVNANAKTGERGSDLTDIAVVTPHAPRFTKRLLDNSFRPVGEAGRPPARQGFRRRGVQVMRYTYLPMVGDVVGVLSACIGKPAKTIQRGHAVFIISLVPSRAPASAPTRKR